MSRKLFGSHDLLLNSWDCLKQSTNPSVMSGNISHVTRKVVLTDQESAPPAPPLKMRRRLSGKTAPPPLRRPVAIFGGGDFPQAAAAPGPGLLRRGRQPQPSPRLTLQGPPLQKLWWRRFHTLRASGASRFGFAMHGTCATQVPAHILAVSVVKLASNGSTLSCSNVTLPRMFKRIQRAEGRSV